MTFQQNNEQFRQIKAITSKDEALPGSTPNLRVEQILVLLLQLVHAASHPVNALFPPNPEGISSVDYLLARSDCRAREKRLKLEKRLDR